MHPILIFVGKIIVDTIPGMRQEISWTLVNLIYLGVSRCPVSGMPPSDYPRKLLTILGPATY